jgi:hypothetical protein
MQNGISGALVITRKRGKFVTIRLAPRTARAIDLAIGERADGRRLDVHGAGRIVRKRPGAPGPATPLRSTSCGVHYRRARVRSCIECVIPRSA